MSKSKEEILDGHLAAYSLKMSDIAFGTTVIPHLLKNAMEEYSKSQCIAFQEFIRKGGYKETLFGLYALHTHDSEKMAAFSIHHLYDLFIQHQSQQP